MELSYPFRPEFWGFCGHKGLMRSLEQILNIVLQNIL